MKFDVTRKKNKSILIGRVYKVLLVTEGKLG
jgi:hypothetical protein